MAFITYDALLGWQTMYFSLARLTAHREPEVNVVPQPLMDSSISEIPGTSLSYYGNTFEVPWKGMAKLKSISNITDVKFDSGQVLMIWAPTGKRGFLQDAAEDKATGSPQLRALFANDIEHGPYQEESALLNATSDQVKFFDPSQVSARRFFLLFMKALAEPSEMKTGIYAFHTPVVHGFQIGNPVYSGRTRLDFFDSNGNSLGEIICFVGKGPSARGTQSDVNRIIQTFHPVATVPATTSAATTNPH